MKNNGKLQYEIVKKCEFNLVFKVKSHGFF